VEKGMRGSAYETAQQNRELDRLGGFGGANYAYSNYSPYYKYGSSYKRYY
jgi:hypothetical protein